MTFVQRFADLVRWAYWAVGAIIVWMIFGYHYLPNSDGFDERQLGAMTLGMLVWLPLRALHYVLTGR